MRVSVAVGSDHRGVAFRGELLDAIAEWDEIKHTRPYGPASPDNAADYPVPAGQVAEKVSAGLIDFGVVICGSGHGVNIAANRYPYVRSATCRTVEDAVMARLHNDANIVSIGSDFTDVETAIEIVKAFIVSPFDGGARHQNRIALIDKLPKYAQRIANYDPNEIVPKKDKSFWPDIGKMFAGALIAVWVLAMVANWS